MYEFVMVNFDHLYPNWNMQTISFEEWNERDNFSRARKNNHIKAYEDLSFIPLNPKDYFRSSFIKQELMYKEEHYDVRLISGCSDRYNVFFGPPLLAFGKTLSYSWDLDHWLLYTSGTTAEDISTWLVKQCDRLGLDNSTTTFLCADESRQDAHVSLEAKQWEHKMFSHLGVSDDVVEALELSLTTTGFGRFGMMYRRDGGRDTGTPETSSGNSHMNGLKMVNWLCTSIPNVNIDNPPFAICIQGDDSLVVFDKEYLENINSESLIQHSALLGFKVKFVKITNNIYDVDYCSRYFWPTDNHQFGYVLAPKTGKVLTKIGFARSKVENISLHNRGIALGMEKSVSNVPFLREWCQRLLELTSDEEDVAISSKYKINSSEYHDYNTETWDTLFYHYQLTELDLAVFKQQLDEIQSLPWKIDFPGNLRDMVLHDFE
jgi:hypothetical protein